MERIKNGYQGVIPSICVEVFHQTKSQEEFGIVRRAADAAQQSALTRPAPLTLAARARSATTWWPPSPPTAPSCASGSTSVRQGGARRCRSSRSHHGNRPDRAGCYKQEPYGAMSLITPCPSHVICSHLQNLKGRPFCKAPESDYVNEEGEAPEGSGSGSDSGSS